MHNNTQNSLESSSLSNLTEDNVLNWYNNKRNSGNITFLTGDDYSEDMGGSFDPKVFWCVNAFIFVLLVGTIVWCCFCDKSWLFNVNPEERRQRSDEIYRRRILAQRQRQEQAKQETPAKRTKKLLKSFAQNKVQMVRKELSSLALCLISSKHSPLSLSFSSKHNYHQIADRQGGRFD